ncbi:GNAT family N-acetyltransferase [Streptomyces endophytica]|uniref:GNAT family N-acetyltransferase n=1 Tax=Streptomyces endophytica TaxID=2991496 RepID=A0ABY6PFA4_9ACTN|nr:GNAT family N-acetyltransferase [Streptomyces endophytica]UZJ32065.1 GNAT family N-acetyltransferase [Streptomyces endophytica]
MTVTVRDFRPADAKAVADLRRLALPHLLATPQSVAWEVSAAAAAQCLRLFVAERDGGVVGSVRAQLLHESSRPGQATATPHVHPDHRGRGVGHALLTSAENHLAAAGATRLLAWAVDEPGAVAFAERHGYRRTRAADFLRLDLPTADLPPLPAALPPGVRLHSGTEWEADPRPLFAAYAEVSADEPGDVRTDTMGYDDWLRHTWEHPLIDPDLTSVVTVDGGIAALSLAATDGLGRYGSAMTGSLRAHRGRGLARLAKTASLHRAREAGCRVALTGNDSSNAPMLAINRALGYRSFTREWTYAGELGPGRRGGTEGRAAHGEASRGTARPGDAGS